MGERGVLQSVSSFPQQEHSPREKILCFKNMNEISWKIDKKGRKKLR